jgi:hypothetical protein
MAKTKSKIATQARVPAKKMDPNGSSPKIEIMPWPRIMVAHWTAHNGARNTTKEGGTRSIVPTDGGCSNRDMGMSVATTEEVNPRP